MLHRCERETKIGFYQKSCNYRQTSRPRNRPRNLTYISANVIYCVTYTLCKKIHIRETARRLADRFRKHLPDVEKTTQLRPNQLHARHLNLPNHYHNNSTICRLSLHQGNTGGRKNLEQKLIFKLDTLYPHGINDRFSFHRD